MLKGRKPINPVDRALADVNAQIADLERQLREMKPGTGAPPPAPKANGFIKSILTPPEPTAPQRPARRVPEIEINPVSELDPEPLPFVRREEPDLFTARPNNATPPGDKLARLLGVGALQGYKPQLKRVERETRHRFLKWLGLSIVALWLIYAWLR